MKLRPCDCKDQVTAQKLSEQGVSHNEVSIMLDPGIVIIKRGYATIEIPMYHFKILAEWYLEEQDVDVPDPIINYDTSVK